MADIRDPFAKPNLSAGRDLVSRPNFTIPGADTPQMSAARPAPDSVMPSRPTGRDLVTRPNFTMGGKAPLPMVDEVVRAPTQPVSPTVRDPKFATRSLSPEAQQFRSTMFQGPKTPPGWTPPSAAPTAAPTAASAKAPMPSTGGIRRAGEALKSGATNLVKSPVKTLAYGTGNLASKVVKGAPLALGAHTVSHFNDYKIDDPGVDSSAAGTLAAITKGDFAGAGRSLSKGALEASMDLGSAGANLLDYVVPGKAPVSSAYDRMLRNAFGDQLVGPSGATEPPTPTAEQATAARPGIRPFTPNEGGRGAGFKDPRVVADPATSLRKDFSGELAGVPQNLPSGLENGRVYKTTDANGRTVYSGRNVRENAGVVDGQGGLRGYLGGGNPEPATDAQGRRLDGRLPEAPLEAPTVISAQAAAAGQPPAAQNVVQAGVSPSSFGLGGADAAVSQARQAAADRGDWGAVSRSYGEAPQGGQGSPNLRMNGTTASDFSGGPSSAETFRQQVARSNAESAIASGLKGNSRERGRAMQAMSELTRGDQDAATRRYSTDVEAGTSRYTSDNSLRGSVYSADSQNDASRYTADMGLRSAYAKNMPSQMQRQAQSMAMQMANGDIPTAMKILASQGYSTEGLGATLSGLNSDQTTQQNLYKGAEEGAMARFKNFVPTDAEGKPVYGGEAQVMNAIESAVPGYSRMGADAQARYAPMVQSTLSIIKGLNTTANNSLLQTIGWDPANPRIDQLPGLKGAKLGQVGKLSGILPGDGVSSGDYSLDLGGGRVLYLPRDQIGENELALLRAKGVNVPQ